MRFNMIAFLEKGEWMRSLSNLAGAVLLAALFATAAAAQRADLSVTMTGLQAIPGPGDPDGTGTVEIRVEPNNDRICWTLFARQIDAATGARIHRGAEGSAGPPVITLTTPDSSGQSRGCAAIDETLAREMATGSHRFYVSVLTAAFPDGAIRGQLRGGLPERRRSIF